MAWICSQCGQENRVEPPRLCEACGTVDFGAVILVGETGKEIVLQVNADIGRATLRSLVGEDERFASEPQFSLKKDAGLKSWVVLASPSATNPTMVNGMPCPDGIPTPIKASDIIAIGSRKTPDVAKAKLQVAIRYKE